MMSSGRVVLQLLLLVVAWTPAVLKLVSSDPGSGYGIESGNVTSEAAEASAVAKLSNSPNQENWWQLAKVPWHDSGIQRFFAAGPLQAHEMQALAAQNDNPHSWHAANIQIDQQDLSQALQRISTFSYRMNKSIAGTGNIAASEWMLLFKCIGTSCSDGYMVPMVMVPVAATAGRASDDLAYVYATLWLPATTSLLVNAIPFSIFDLLPPPNSVPAALPDLDDSDLSLAFNVRDHGLSSCPPTALANCRNLLDGAYGLLPSTACIRLRSIVDQTSFNLLVSIPASSSVTSVKSLLSTWLRVAKSSWALQPFEACSEEAVLVPSVGSGSKVSFIMCYKGSCKGRLLRTNMSCSSGILLLKSLLAYIKASPECTSTQLDYKSVNVSCQFLATSERCAFADFRDYDTESGDSMLTVSAPTSRWTSTNGLDTKEFQKSFGHPTTSAEHAPCTVEVPSLSLSIKNMSSSVHLPLFKAIQMRARAYLAGYITEHNIAFTTSKGPPTDLYTFIALVVSTAFSVILAISGPFTSFLLREISKRFPQHLDNKHGKAHQVAKVCLQVGCNMVLSMVSFLPVLSVAINELEREKPFYTWDLGSCDLDGYNPLHPDKLRVLYLVSAVSQYDSHFLTAITVTVCVTCFIVAGCTAWRCIQIFGRYSLLKEYDEKMAGGYAVSASNVHRALRAIEMSEAETEKMRRIGDQRQPMGIRASSLLMSMNDAAGAAQITSGAGAASSLALEHQLPPPPGVKRRPAHAELRAYSLPLRLHDSAADSLPLRLHDSAAGAQITSGAGRVWYTTSGPAAIF